MRVLPARLNCAAYLQGTLLPGASTGLVWRRSGPWVAVCSRADSGGARLPRRALPLSPFLLTSFPSSLSSSSEPLTPAPFPGSFTPEGGPEPGLVLDLANPAASGVCRISKAYSSAQDTGEICHHTYSGSLCLWFSQLVIKTFLLSDPCSSKYAPK